MPSFDVPPDGDGPWSVVRGDRMEGGVGEDDDGDGASVLDGGHGVRVVPVVDVPTWASCAPCAWRR